LFPGTITFVDLYLSYMTEEPHKSNALSIHPKKWSLVLMQVKHTRHSC